MEEIDKLEHFTISRRRDGSLWELGRGAMGVTYKALDTNLRSEVTLKVISAQYLGSEPARQRFLREARAAASLQHPNVATVFHLGKVDGLIYPIAYFPHPRELWQKGRHFGSLTLNGTPKGTI